MILKRKLNLFEKNIKYKFKDLNFLKQSLTHPSFYIDSKSLEKKSNQFERLEFLGDRVLGLVVASLLFNKNRCFIPVFVQISLNRLKTLS